MLRFLAIILLAGALSLASSPHLVSAGSSSVTITVDADAGTPGVQASRAVGTGSTFTVDILIGSVSDLQAFNFELAYDQTVLSAPTVTTGPDTDRNPDANQTFLTSTGRSWSCSPPSPSGDTDPSPSVGVAFLSCFSSGGPGGPGAGSGGAVIATIEFDALADGTSALTLRNVNTFKAGGVETGSCNPTVIVAATCTNADISVSSAVGGIAELPEVAGEALEASGGAGAKATLWVAITVGMLLLAAVALGGAAWYARRRLMR